MTNRDIITKSDEYKNKYRTLSNEISKCIIGSVEYCKLVKRQEKLTKEYKVWLDTEAL